MKTFKLRILHPERDWMYDEVKADYVHLTEGAYVFYEKPTDIRQDDDVIISSYPIALTIILSIVDEFADISI